MMSSSLTLVELLSAAFFFKKFQKEICQSCEEVFKEENI